MTQNTPDNQLYEWSLKKIALVAGAAMAALIGKGVKMAINSATVKAHKGKLDKVLQEFKENLYDDVERRAAQYAEAIADEEGNKLTKEKKRAFQKALLDYVKKEISALGKKVDQKIEKLPAGKKGKASLKIYWETITTSVELDILEKLHKLDIIGESDREELSDRASADLEKIIEIFLKKFGVDPEQEPKPSEFEQLKNTFNGIYGAYKNKNELDIEAIEKLIEKIDLWKQFYEKVEGKLSEKEKRELQTDLSGAKTMEESLVEFREDLIRSKKGTDYEKTLYDYMETLFDNRAKYIKSSFDSGVYNDYKDHKKMKRFVDFMVGEVMDDPDEYTKQDKLLSSKSISDKNLIILFLKVFMDKFEEEEKSQNEGFVSFYDYVENHL